MKLSALAAQYVAYKQSMGMRFHTEARTLKSFCQAMGDIAIADIAADRVHAYITGVGPVTSFWHRKYGVLRGFYRFAMARGYASSCPLPKIIPKPPQFVPHIFSHEELQRLLDASVVCESPRSKLKPYTCRMLILLLYGAGLRISEALSLTLANVDLPAGILTIRESKFYKTRLVPMSPALTTAVGTFMAQRAEEHSTESDTALFLTRTAIPLARHTAENIFRRLRVQAGVLCHDGGRYQPRLHDLRHAAAVHRLVSWYRQGADVQRLLPQLATYLGHIHIAATQRYLTLTPELLHEASLRFEPRGSPKTGHRGSLQNRPTITIIQDVDFDVRTDTLGRCEQCLERGKEAASHSVWPARLVAAQDSEDHRCPPRNRS
jgi:integrase/recombinase XerD